MRSLTCARVSCLLLSLGGWLGGSCARTTKDNQRENYGPSVSETNIQVQLPSALPVKSLEAVASSSSTLAVDTCVPKGVAPRLDESYTIDGPSVSLASDWTLLAHASSPKQVFEGKFLKAATEQVRLPITREQKTLAKDIVWFRRELSLSESDQSRLALDLGGFAGESDVWLNGKKLTKKSQTGPLVFRAPLPWKSGVNVLVIRVVMAKWVGGVFAYGMPRVGEATRSSHGFVARTFTSAIDKKEHTVRLLVPKCADLSQKRPLLVVLPGWSGTIDALSHSRLLQRAESAGWLVLTPDTRGNFLYTGDSERGVLEAVDLIMREWNVDDTRVFITGVSMGGAGALQLAYHYPHRFAGVVAFYPDSLYDLRSYVGPILQTNENAERYSVRLFPENGRTLPVMLVHAKDDNIVPVAESTLLYERSQKLGFSHHKMHTPDKGGHSLLLVERYADDAFTFLKDAKRENPKRVSFRTNNRAYAQAHWLSIVHRTDGPFAYADVLWNADKLVLDVFAMERLGELRINTDALLARDVKQFRIAFHGNMRTPVVLSQGRDSSWRSAQGRAHASEHGLKVTPEGAGTLTLVRE